MGGKLALHAVSAFGARQRLVLGQRTVDTRSNEIAAIPKLLEMLMIVGAVVTIGPMGCQRDIARTILDKRADYVLVLKGNPGMLRADVERLVAEQKAADFKDVAISRHRTVEGDQRPHRGTHRVIHGLNWLRERNAC